MFVALARLLDCRLITLDLKLRRASARLGFVIGPTEL
jgi:predicted nucleic acid-binding protein